MRVCLNAPVLTVRRTGVFARLQSLLSKLSSHVTDHLLLSSHAGAGDEAYRLGPDAYSAVLTESQIHHLHKFVRRSQISIIHYSYRPTQNHFAEFLKKLQSNLASMGVLGGCNLNEYSKLS